MIHVKSYESINELFGWGKKKSESDTPKPIRNRKKGDELAQIIIDRVDKSYSEKFPIKITEEGFRVYAVTIERDYYGFECNEDL